MPFLKLNLRQRERIIARTRNLQAPYFLVYFIFQAVYTRTYPTSLPDINDPIPPTDTMPFGFTFNPVPQPPLIPLQAQTTLDTPFSPIIPPLPPPPPPTTSPYQVGPSTILVGTTSKPLFPTSFLVQRVTVQADAGNAGKIWISSAKSTPAGFGFPLVAGSAKDEGDIAAPKQIDLSTIFVIGTDVNDKVNIDYTK